ncbi:MAG: hypothetical protein JXR12_05200 [Neptunomonas phycophila]|uniref:hypothetical protein n=1 Tax=Neptunomonas phycophila TaxID=1572645 RepID=UPI003B8E3905
MKLVELHEQNILTDQELDTLYESVAATNPELKELIAKQLALPFQKEKKNIISNFIPKLKAWAMDAMNKESDTDFVSKVLNNPELVAKQLLNNISSRSNNEQADTVAKPTGHINKKPTMYRFKKNQ